MPWRRLPWRFLIRRIARAHGFLDPVSVVARLRHFAEPSEVGEPIELLRAGLAFHARGLINSRVIQHNLDWVWPFWIERQFNPLDDAFIPRGFSMTHCNLSHRNWTAIGWPDVDALPIVDPRGLLSPHFDGWSLDAWIVSEDGDQLLPSRAASSSQRLELTKGVTVRTTTRHKETSLTTRAKVVIAGQMNKQTPTCQMQVQAASSKNSWLVIALRPCNPEGISAIYEIILNDERRQWLINGVDKVTFDHPVAHHHVSDYRAGDVNFHLNEAEQQRGDCRVGMASAAAMFPIKPGKNLHITVDIPLNVTLTDALLTNSDAANDEGHASWADALDGSSRIAVPDKTFQFLYEAALKTLILHSPGDVYPGPFTYKRFWFRDAAFIIQALLYTGLTKRAERALDRFPIRQKHNGYFHSQDGEWDSNGEALWIMNRYLELTNQTVKPEWRKPILRGARWINNKRLPTGSDTPQAGLLPAGFSAEHLGPNDYYYWDDFWGIAGLRAAADLCSRDSRKDLARPFTLQAEDFELTVNRSLARASQRLRRPAMPASPSRRLDAGAIGSLAAGYPLQLFAPDDPRLLDTANFLLDRCFVDGGFFQDMIHSGINPYLTLHIAQILLRAGDPRYFELMTSVASLASATGQWPEAIHPRTRGGCMGDGQHVWAAAEWVVMLRNCFIREENNCLILGSGIPRQWLTDGMAASPIRFGPSPTSFGTVSVEIIASVTVNCAQKQHRCIKVCWSARWHNKPPGIEVRLPGFMPVKVKAGVEFVELQETPS